jgi:hypothetical protein
MTGMVLACVMALAAYARISVIPASYILVKLGLNALNPIAPILLPSFFLLLPDSPFSEPCSFLFAKQYDAIHAVARFLKAGELWAERSRTNLTFLRHFLCLAPKLLAS